MSAFKIVVKTDNAGTSSSTQFTLPLDTAATYNFHIDWGDDTEEDVTTNTDKTHTYSEAGTYEISITENTVLGFPLIYFYNRYDKLKLLEISQWGTNKWASLYRSFYGCANMTITATDHATANFGSVAIADYAFTNCAAITSFPALDLQKVVTAIYAWGNCTSMTTFETTDLRKCQVFTSSWRNDTALLSFPVIRTDAGVNYTNTWENCSSLEEFPLLDFANAVYLSATWKGCSGLTTFPLINTIKVTTLADAWQACPLTSFPQINTSACTSFANTWRGTSIVEMPFLDTSKGTNFFETWAHCHYLTTLPAMDFSKGTTFEYCWWENWLLTDFPVVKFDEGVNFYAAWGESGIRNFPNIQFPKGEDFTYAFKDAPLANMGAVNFPSLNAADSMFIGVKLATVTYSDMLKYLAENNTNEDVVFSAGTSDYYKYATQYRDILIGKGWTITDGSELKDPCSKNDLNCGQIIHI